ncbi:MAG: hypothetical protein COB15_11390 [Flavobacteriales bacterium]|nr:MAG: hypothetical protein COB15_11390 [Flavobacteriales bacterium]
MKKALFPQAISKVVVFIQKIPPAPASDPPLTQSTRAPASVPLVVFVYGFRLFYLKVNVPQGRVLR